MTAYPFFVLSLLLFIPPLFIFLIRVDLRPVMMRVSAMSLPFAFTEFLFYPDYWEPATLFDLVPRYGFGIEDFMFVAGLGAFTSTAYAFTFRQRLESIQPHPSSALWKRSAVILGVVFVVVGAATAAKVPMIYAANFIMVATTIVILVVRRDLVVPAVLGAIIVGSVYGLICLLLGAIIPEVFELNWKTENFMNVFVLGVPIEEILYATTAGGISTVFYPFVSGTGYVK